MFLAWSPHDHIMVNVGDDAPDFSLLDHNNNTVSGSDYKGQKVILAFFPAAFTGICTKANVQDARAGDRDVHV